MQGLAPAWRQVSAAARGWRTARPEDRHAALRHENAVLLGVLAERDAALQAADVKLRKLREEHQAMLVRWRGARSARAAEARVEPSREAAATPRETADVRVY